MTTVVIGAGICGFITKVEVVRLSARRVSVALDSDCEVVSQIAEQIRELNWQDTLREREKSLVYKSALQCIKHVACPVYVAIIKAVEVEVGVALPRDVVIHFETVDGK